MAKRNTYFEDEVVHKKIDIKQFGRILKYIMPYKHIFIIVCVLMLVSACTALLPPMLLRYVINDVVVEKSMAKLFYVVCGLVFLAATDIGLTYAQQRMMGQMGHSVIADMRKDIFYKLQELPFEYFDNRPDGKIVVRVTDYINDLANFFTNYVVMFLVYLVKIVIVTIFMLSLSPELTIIVVCTVVPMMALVFLLRYKIRRRFAWHRAKLSNRSAFLIETIMGEKIVKNYNRVEKNKSIYEDLHNQSVNVWWGIVKLNNLNTPIVEIFWNIGTLCLYGVALYLILNGSSQVDAGTVVAFISYMGLFSGPLTQIAIIIQQMAQVSSNLEQVFDTIDYEVQIKDEEGDVSLDNVKGQVDFDNVTFSYEDDINILENMNLHVKPGETIALVGPTGAGKTTIINLITRFYDVTGGVITIDGQDVRKLTLESLRSQIGLVQQDVYLFCGSIKENIAYGKPGASMEEIEDAARKANIHDFIMELPDGYDTFVGERGTRLSGGQKQRISIARVFLKNPSILILDEATSALDNESERWIQKSLEELAKNRTTITIAHRLSTIRNADEILVVADNGIAERGTHEELLEKGGIYAHYYEMS